jgi:CheY-like chemotaxis protein
MANHICFLIDDDEDDRDIFEMALDSASAEIELATAKNGVEAFRIIDDNPAFRPEFIFIDLNMPYMSGIDCLTKIRQYPHMADVPVVMYTTSSYQKDVDEAKQLGASHFLVKPSGMAALTSILSSLLGKKDMPFFISSDN